KAKKAKPFYQARRSDPMSVHMRRRFTLDDELRLKDITDEILEQVAKDVAPAPQALPAEIEGAPLAETPEEAVSPPDETLEIVARGANDAILVEMEAARSAEMRDIVATIQADQYDQISDG